jgi:hypothetical protein
MSDEGPDRSWARRGARVERAAERVIDLPLGLVARGHPINDAAKQAIYAAGVDARASILKAPTVHPTSVAKENVARFKVRVEMPGEEPYKARVWQAFTAEELEQLKKGSTVDCKVVPDDHKRVLLITRELGRSDRTPKQ